jgi:hypothetical protein
VATNVEIPVGYPVNPTTGPEEEPRNTNMIIPTAEPPRVEPQRIEPPRVEQPLFEQPRTEPPRVEQPQFEQPRMEPPRVEPPRPRMDPPHFEQPRVENPRMEQLEVGFRFEPPQRVGPVRNEPHMEPFRFDQPYEPRGEFRNEYPCNEPYTLKIGGTGLDFIITIDKTMEEMAIMARIRMPLREIGMSSIKE